jgi:hypothetical protein
MTKPHLRCLSISRAAALVLAAIVCISCSPSAPLVPPLAAVSVPISPEKVSKPPPLVSTEPVQPAPLHSVMEAQRALNDLGYSVGKPDGILGAATHKAVIAFQRDRRLVVDGLLTGALIEKLMAIQAELPKTAALTIGRGDVVIYSDGSIVTATSDGPLPPPRQQEDATVIAIRPFTGGWPTEAKIGLDWAATHALDEGASDAPIVWSSTGVGERFEIRAFSFLSLRDAKLGNDDAQVCRRFEMREDQPRRTYPAIACKNDQGRWLIPHSRIVLAAPATGLNNKKEIATK